MDVQLLLVFILVLLAVSLAVVAVYVVMVLREFKDALKKVNTMLDDAHSIGSIVTKPTARLIPLANAIIDTVKSTKSVSTIADVEEEDELEELKPIKK